MRKGLLIVGAILASINSFGQEAGELHMRVRATGAVPMEDAKIEAIGGNVAVTNNLIPEIDFTYYITKNIAAELILGTSKHEVVAVNTALGNLDLGRVMLLPPTLNVQYHLYPTKNLKPYVGAGINYTIFYDQGQGKGRNAAVTSVDYKNNVGFGFQFGFDYKINDKLYWNVDVKKLYLNTDVTVGAALDQQVYVPADVDLNPWLISTGIGFKLF